MQKKIVIIGGGASGFFAAINLAKAIPDADITLLEKSNQLLSKVKVSGGGRCNVTHAVFDPKELSTNYPRGEREFLGPFNYFAPGDIISWFHERGVELKIEDDGRMFPITDSSQTIIDCFLKEAKHYGVKIKLSSEVTSIGFAEGFKISCKNGEAYEADRLIVCIGGNPKLKHYHFLSEIGHTIVAPIPSLFTFNLPKHPSNQLMGISHSATVSLVGVPYEEHGPLLFTHWGMSGPAILKLSSKAANFLFKKNYQFEYKVGWLDDVQSQMEEKRSLQGATIVGKNKLTEMPLRLWEYLLDRANISKSKKWADLNKGELESLNKTLTSDTYSANGKTTFKEEFVTCGGIDLKEINLKKMASKKVEGLYFCGEVMNVDAITGGFNFQAAWTSAYLAAKAIAEND